MSYMKQNKKHKQTLKSAQYGLESALTYHGRRILTKKWKKKIFLLLKIEKTEINILQKNGERAFLRFKLEEKNYF